MTVIFSPTRPPNGAKNKLSELFRRIIKGLETILHQLARTNWKLLDQSLFFPQQKQIVVNKLIQVGVTSIDLISCVFFSKKISPENPSFFFVKIPFNESLFVSFHRKIIFLFVDSNYKIPIVEEENFNFRV